MLNTRNVAIKNIKVERLFGLFNYNLPGNNNLKDIEKMLILYGDNGTGKTTILRLIFHLLATEDSVGHKTFVAKTKFKAIEILLTNGYLIWAKREKDIIGSYEIGIKFKNKVLNKFKLETNKNNDVRHLSRVEQIAYSQLLKSLGKLNISFYLLSDDRNVYVGNVGGREIGQEGMLKNYILKASNKNEAIYDYENALSKRMDLETMSILLLEESITRTSSWIRAHVMKQSSRGDSDVNYLYESIIKRVAASHKEPILYTFEYIKEKIRNIEKRSQAYSCFGLMPVFKGSEMLSLTQKASKNHFNIMVNILNPYLDSILAKLKALEEMKTLIEKLVTLLNSFFTNKYISFNTVEGLQVISSSGEKLLPSMLSSGERHLLLLFCNSITALDVPSIIIIDEPELSLNIKWQRKLVDSLINLIGNKSVQYIFATHSFEILAKHNDKVIRLDNIKS